MAKSYKCKRCGELVIEHVIPKIIVKEGLCVACYKAKLKADRR